MTIDHTAERRLRDFTTDTRLLLVTLFAAMIGVAATGAAYVLVRLIGLFTHLFYFQDFGTTLISPVNHRLGWLVVLIPVVGGLIVGAMARYGSSRIRGHGIPEALEAILIGGSRMDAKIAVLKPLSSAIAIGSGGPFGAEGPIIMTGGACGSLFAQAFHLTGAERKTLLVAGAAGGMAAIFASPVAAVLLAVELLLFEWKPRSFIPVAAAAAVAGTLRIPLLGAGPVFPLPAHAALSARGLVAALAAGILAGFAASVITRLVYACEDAFHRVPIHWMWWPAIGGVVVGIGGLIDPHALGVGYDTLRDILTGRLAGTAVIVFLIVKAVIWSFALGSGTSGGVLAPLLLMGAALGATEAQLVHASEPGLWALVSMGAMMSATMGAPLTAIVFVLELSHEVALLPAVLVAGVAAYAVGVLAIRRSILTEKVARRGLHVMREYVVDPFHRLRVEDVMETNVPTVPADLPVAQLFRRLAEEDPVLARRQAWPLVEADGALAGMVTRGDLLRALDEDDADTLRLRDAGATNLVVTHPDELLEEAVARMMAHDVSRLPVVPRHEPRRLVGYLGSAGLMTAWIRSREEEVTRDGGWLADRIEPWRDRIRRILAR